MSILLVARIVSEGLWTKQKVGQALYWSTTHFSLDICLRTFVTFSWQSSIWQLIVWTFQTFSLSLSAYCVDGPDDLNVIYNNNTKTWQQFDMYVQTYKFAGVQAGRLSAAGYMAILVHTTATCWTFHGSDSAIWKLSLLVFDRIFHPNVEGICSPLFLTPTVILS